MQKRITVQAYAGYKGDERPVSFSQEGRTWRIIEIVDRWYDPDNSCFKVLADDGRTYLLRHDMNADSWEMVEAPLTPSSGPGSGTGSPRRNGFP